MNIILYKSEAVDRAITALEGKMRNEGKHLIKTESIIQIVSNLIDLTDTMQERQELLEIGIKQVIQGRLYARGYFSVTTGYFVNVLECENLVYLNMIINGKDDVIEGKVKARNRVKELTDRAGSTYMVPDKDNNLILVEYKPIDELMDDLEADAV